MGLDITAYRGLKEAHGSEAFDETGELRDDSEWVQIYKNPDFPHSAEELEDRHAYRFAESFGFRAGSYGGYTMWRESLAKLAGYPAMAPTGNSDHDSYVSRAPHSASAWGNPSAASLPFHELINFSDCEGVIGAGVSAKLARDFAAFQEKADAHPDQFFRERYNNWRKAFEMASDNGAVEFH